MKDNEFKKTVNASRFWFFHFPVTIAFLLMYPLMYVSHSLYLSVTPATVCLLLMIPGTFFEFMYIFKRVDLISLHTYLENVYQKNLDMFLFRRDPHDIENFRNKLLRMQYSITEDGKGYTIRKHCIVRYPNNFWMPFARTYILQITVNPEHGLTELPEFMNDLPVFHTIIITDPSLKIDESIPHLCAVVVLGNASTIIRKIPIVDSSLAGYDRLKHISFYRKRVAKELMLIENSISVNATLNRVLNRF